MPLELKQASNKLNLEKKHPSITTIGRIVVDAVYDEEFMISDSESSNIE